MIGLLMTGAVSLVAGQPLAAAPFKAAPHTRQMTDLDTAPGHFSVWTAQDLDGINAIRLRFRINAVAKDPDKKWAPIFRFQLKRGDQVVQLSLTGFAGKTPLLLQFQQVSGRTTTSDEQIPALMQVGELADLAIDWSADGKASFLLKSADPSSPIAQGRVYTGQLAGSPSEFTILGSTGEIEVQSIELGTSTGG